MVCGTNIKSNFLEVIMKNEEMASRLEELGFKTASDNIKKLSDKKRKMARPVNAPWPT